MSTLGKLSTTLLIVESFTLPVFRSGGRTGLSFWGWVLNHTVFGPPVEYVPEEDYARELEGVARGVLATSGQAGAHFQAKETAAANPPGPKKNALSMFDDLYASVRHDKDFHSIRNLVQPDDPEVREIAAVLEEAPDFIEACQDFVDSFTTYKKEVGDYWAEPREVLEARAGDCDCKAILLCSLLRTVLPATQVFCAIGDWTLNGRGGHMWVVTKSNTSEDRVIEATASSMRPVKGSYHLQAIFNDVYAFATPAGLKEFALLTG